jgi:hypothetical protein
MSHLLLYIDFLISGYNPFGVRLTHLLLHIGNLLAVYALAKLFFKKSAWAVLAAALFALHPNAREAVISTLPQDLLATLGFLWGLWFWGKYLLDPSKRVQWLALSLAALAFGILSKELLLIFPVLAFALQVAFRLEGRIEKLELNRLWWTYALQLVVLGVYWIYRLSLLGGVGGYKGAGHFSFTPEMIRNTVRVVNGSFFVESSVEAAQFSNLGWLLGTSIAGIITLLGLRPRKLGSAGWTTAFAFVFMFISAAAVLNFSWLGWWYIYLPLAGVAIGVTGLLREAVERWPGLKQYCFASGMVLAIVLIPLTVNHIAALKENRALKERIYDLASAQVTPTNTTVYIWQQEVQAFMRFDLHQDFNLPPETKTLYFENRFSVVHMADHPLGLVFVGYNIMPPFDMEFQPHDQFFSMRYKDNRPILESIEKEDLQRQLSEVKPRQRKPRTHM